MRKLIRNILLLFLVSPLYAIDLHSLPTEYVQDEYVVVFDSTVPEIAMAQVESQISATYSRGSEEVKLFRMPESKDLSSGEVAAAYSFCDELRDLVEGVRFCEPNYLYQTAQVPNDPLYPSLYALQKVSAPEAWSITTGSSSVVVAVLDTGIDYSHPDLNNNMWINDSFDPEKQQPTGSFHETLHGANFVASANDIMDDNGHGTHVSGIVGAVGNNSTGSVGMSWKVSLMGLKFLNHNGGGTLFNAVQAIDFAVERGAHIINASWGGPAHSTVLRDAIKRAGEAGILFVAAAGNTGKDFTEAPFYPAAYNLNNIIAVASTDATDRLSSFSGYSKSRVHIAAPGSMILSTLPGGEYGELSGTSMAAPMVAGAAALLLAEHPENTFAQIRNRILSGDKLKNLSTLVSTGARLNVWKALTSDGDFPDLEEPNMIASAYNRRTGQRNFSIPLRAGYKIELNDPSLVNGEQIRFRFRSRGRRCILGRVTVEDGQASLTGRVPRGIRGRPVMMAGRDRAERIRFVSRRQCIERAGRRDCLPRERLSRDNYRNVCSQFRALVD